MSEIIFMEDLTDSINFLNGLVLFIFLLTFGKTYYSRILVCFEKNLNFQVYYIQLCIVFFLISVAPVIMFLFPFLILIRVVQFSSCQQHVTIGDLKWSLFESRCAIVHNTHQTFRSEYKNVLLIVLISITC